MLKYRLLTAFILIPLVLLILFYAPYSVFIAANALAILAAGWEWASLSKIKTLRGKFAFLALLACTLVGSFWVSNIILWIAGAWWLIAGILVLSAGFKNTSLPPVGGAVAKRLRGAFRVARSPVGGAVAKRLRGACRVPLTTQGSSREATEGGFSCGSYSGIPLIGLLILTPTFTALNLLRSTNPELVFWLFLFIWGADSFAYFAGKLWGKHKLIPRVSPAKTWEGFIAALVTCVVVGVLASMRNLGGTLTSWIVIAVIIGITSVLGDLFESMIKRLEGVKDSGSLLPGHGGLLDRLDSLTSAAPIFALIWNQFI